MGNSPWASALYRRGFDHRQSWYGHRLNGKRIALHCTLNQLGQL